MGTAKFYRYGNAFGSYGKSTRAEEAEQNGRYPRTRAAKHMGISVAAFDAGVQAVGYACTEWHHVGKYATPVNYYDTVDLAQRKEFWEGAASAYKSPYKKSQVLSNYESHDPSTLSA